MAVLQHAAFQGVIEYRPHAVARKLTRRLFEKYKDEDKDNMPTRHHLVAMNKIGMEVNEIHQMWLNMKQIGFRKDFVLRELKESRMQRRASMAVIDIMDRVRAIHAMNLDIAELRRVEDPKRSKVVKTMGKCSAHQLRLRFPMAIKYYFRDGWNWVDSMNYTVFLISFGLRINTLRLVPGIGQVWGIEAELDEIQTRVAEVPKESADSMFFGTLDAQYSTYVNFILLATWSDVQSTLTAFNAVLTWVKLFKYLEWHPQMTVLINTLKKGGRPLAFFFFTLVVVLIGSAQGFFMAFGVDTYDYRDLRASLLSMLRMAVGDFDYSALQSSHAVVGPVMFWIYIILVFFVLMSMFIALISEAYDEAREDLAARKAGGAGVKGSGNSLVYARDTDEMVAAEAEKRIEMTGDPSLSIASSGLMSRRMYDDFAVFRDAVPKFKLQAARQRAAREETIARASGKQEMQRRRRMSVNQLSAITGGGYKTAAKLGDRKEKHGNSEEAGDDKTGGDGKDEQKKRGLAALKDRLRNSFLGKQIEWRVHWNLGYFEMMETRAHGRKFRANVDYAATHPKMLSFCEGDTIIVVSAPPQRDGQPAQMWKGYLSNR